MPKMFLKHTFRQRSLSGMESQATNTTAWMDRNLETQGYRLGELEGGHLWFGLRFSTAVCLALVTTALVLQSAPMLFVMCGIGAVAGFTSRHPFDYLWNHGVRHLMGGAAIPPNPARRRHSFKIATVWLFAVAMLFVAGQNTIALVLGATLVAVCSVVTATNLCMVSLLFAWWDRLRGVEATA